MAMIDRKMNNLAWIELVDHLDEAREHIERLVDDMTSADDFDEERLAIDLGHIYAHLNRVWNARRNCKGMSSMDWSEITEFPRDLEPVG